MNQDLYHLRLLSVFYYVVGGLAALFSLFPVFHLVFGIAMITGELDTGDASGAAGDPMTSFMGWFFVLFALGWIALGLTFAACLVFAGRFLARQQRYTYCLVVAGLACMFVPFGTVLGVLTIIVLMRLSVQELFGHAAPASASVAP